MPWASMGLNDLRPSKNIWGLVPIVLDGPNVFSSGPNHFIQVMKISPEKSNLNLAKMIWTVQNHFGPIEGQGRNT